MKSQPNKNNLFSFQLIFLILTALACPQISSANAENLRDGTSITKFNYPAVCVFTDFLTELIPPIDARLVRSKNTKKMDSEWIIESLPHADPDLKYYFHRTETGIEMYFLFSSEIANFVSASIPGKLMPSQMQKPQYLAWLFGIEIDDLSNEHKGLGCESIDLTFDISKDKSEIYRVNLKSSIE